MLQADYKKKQCCIAVLEADHTPHAHTHTHTYTHTHTRTPKLEHTHTHLDSLVCTVVNDSERQAALAQRQTESS